MRLSICTAHAEPILTKIKFKTAASTTAIKAEGKASFLSGLLSHAKIKNKLSKPISAAPPSKR